MCHPPEPVRVDGAVLREADVGLPGHHRLGFQRELEEVERLRGDRHDRTVETLLVEFA
jgi:hypothetical protein